MDNGATEDEAILDMVNKIEEFIPISFESENIEMVKFNHFITESDKSQWSKMEKGRLHASFDFMTLRDKLYTSIANV